MIVCSPHDRFRAYLSEDAIGIQVELKARSESRFHIEHVETIEAPFHVVRDRMVELLAELEHQRDFSLQKIRAWLI